MIIDHTRLVKVRAKCEIWYDNQSYWLRISLVFQTVQKEFRIHWKGYVGTSKTARSGFPIEANTPEIINKLSSLSRENYVDFFLELSGKTFVYILKKTKTITDAHNTLLLDRLNTDLQQKLQLK